MTDRALDVLFWSGLKQTEETWYKHFNSDYTLRPAGYVNEAQDNAAYRLHVAEQGRALPPPEPGYYENFATGGKAQDDPEVDEIIESAKKEIAKEPEWQVHLRLCCAGAILLTYLTESLLDNSGGLAYGSAVGCAL